MDNLFFYSIIGTGTGIFLFFHGFVLLKKKRTIENIPTSKIRSMAIGLVEVKVKALELNLFSAPFSQKDCVYYRYIIEELRRSKNSSHWVTLHQGNSENAPFYVTDDTGKVLVHPAGAEIELPTAFSYQTGFLKDIPAHITHFLDARNVNYRSFLGRSKTLRFREWNILPQEDIYIIGVCKTSHKDLAGDHRKRLMEALRKVKANPKLMAQFDTNHDGTISAEEWEMARQTIEKNLPALPQEENPVFIGRGEHSGQLFYIAKESEKKLIETLTWKAFGGVFGGAALTLVCLFYVLSNLIHVHS